MYNSLKEGWLQFQRIFAEPCRVVDRLIES